jgi:hypothetical protein
VGVQAVKVERGMLLLVREDATAVLPERHRLWAVVSVRQTQKGATVRLVGWEPGCSIEATATFPSGIVQDPWTVFSLSPRDLAYIFGKLTAHSKAA